MPLSIVSVSVIKTSNQKKAPNFAILMEEEGEKSKATVGDLSLFTQMSQVHPDNRSSPSAERPKLQEQFNRAFMSEFAEHHCWTQDGKRALRNVSVRLLMGTIIFGIVLFAFCELWCYFFSTVDIIYQVNATQSPQPPLQTINVKSSFLKEVMYAESAFTSYAFGSLCLIATGFYAILTFHAAYGTRTCRFILSIIFFLFSTALMIYGPLFPIIARNNATEIKLLQTDEHASYQLKVKGSVDFFTQGQCKDIDGFVKRKNKTFAQEMKLFCDMLYRFTAMMYAMLASTIVPLIAVVICILEIIANRKTWATKAARRYKERTKEQQKRDHCTVD